jgi:hypothetical protein
MAGSSEIGNKSEGFKKMQGIGLDNELSVSQEEGGSSKSVTRECSSWIYVYF